MLFNNNPPMNYTLATGSSVHQMVSLIMVAKPLDVIVGQPTTETMNKMVVQMAQMVALVKTSAWGGCHGSLALVLDDAEYSSITKAKITSTTPVNQPDTIIKSITATSTPLEILTFQEETKKRQKELTCRRWSPTSACNTSSTALKNSTSKNSRKNILVTPTAPSKVFSIISEPTGARS